VPFDYAFYKFNIFVLSEIMNQNEKEMKENSRHARSKQIRHETAISLTESKNEK
jgi:hypothetical protein